MTEKHVHKLKRIKYKSGNVSLFCVMPDCSFKINPALALGKRSLCWRCGNEFLLTEYSLRLAKPHCESCHRPKGFVISDPEFPDDIPKPAVQFVIPKLENTDLADRLKQITQPDEEEI